MDGHKEPDPRTNLCGYCFRHFNYSPVEVGTILDETETRPFFDRIPYMREIERLNEAEEGIVKRRDKFRGIVEMIKILSESQLIA